jgi:hypothetical protein
VTDDNIFPNLPPKPGEGQGWAPAALAQLKYAQARWPRLADTYAQVHNMGPDAARGMNFDDAASNLVRNNMLYYHDEDLRLTQRAIDARREGWSSGADTLAQQLKELRMPGPPPTAAQEPPAQKPRYAPLLDEASVPWNTFRLQQPSMPPAANINRFPMSPPPAVTQAPPGLMSQEEAMQRMREGLLPPQD